jgi:hypothetical protein
VEILAMLPFFLGLAALVVTNLLTDHARQRERLDEGRRSFPG